MGRYLAIDYGSKRCGLAVSDPLKMIASGLDTVPSHELMNFLQDYFNKEAVEIVIVGKPLQLNNQASESFILVERFVSAFKKRFPEIRLEWHDERFTSKMAVDAMIEGGMKKKDRQKRGNVDKVSAALILRSFMDEEGKG